MNLSKAILGITTYNRISYLKKLINTWISTRDKSIEWQIIIADDGSSDGTINFIQSLSIPNVKIKLIENNRRGIHHQTNTIIKEIAALDFDLFFKCDDDIEFLQPGWEKLYWQAIKDTGFNHLCFYDLRWRSEFNLLFPIKKKKLICNTTPRNIQGAFFTITQEVIQEIGYFDTLNFGLRGLGHIDYTLRCCRKGFNNIHSPFDIQNSNKYIALQQLENYSNSISKSIINKINTKEEKKKKEKILTQERIFIPFQEIELSYDSFLKETNHTWKRAENKLVLSRGVYRVIGLFLKYIYNLNIKLGWFWFPKLVKNAGTFFLKIGNDLLDIDK